MTEQGRKTKKIPILGKRGQGIFAIVDEEDYQTVARFRWYINPGGYVFMHRLEAVGQLSSFMHRLILKPEKGRIVDHVDGNPLNNTRVNLRICNSHENMRNTRLRTNNVSGYKGVYQEKGLWISQINKYGKTTRIGKHQTKEEAARAYDLKAIELYGDFARTNFSKEDYGLR